MKSRGSAVKRPMPLRVPLTKKEMKQPAYGEGCVDAMRLFQVGMTARFFKTLQRSILHRAGRDEMRDEDGLYREGFNDTADMLLKFERAHKTGELEAAIAKYRKRVKKKKKPKQKPVRIVRWGDKPLRKPIIFKR